MKAPKSLLWWLVIGSVLLIPHDPHELVLKCRTPSRCHILRPEQLFTAARSLSRFSCRLFGGLRELVSRGSQSLRSSDYDKDSDRGSTKPVPIHTEYDIHLATTNEAHGS